MPVVLPVKFAYASRELWFDPAGVPAEEGDHVICSTERGTEIGLVTADAFEVPLEELAAPLKPVLRIATDEDLDFAEGLAERGEDSMYDFRRLVEKNRLDMKPVAVEYLFGGEKAVFYFAAEDRVDFRQLVKDLASFFHIRVDMRQIGVRDETRLVGGYAHCGQELCCARFGGQFEPVSIRMAKEQDLPLNSSKISGVCGRLMCCLRYEFEAYKDFKGRAPKKKAVIQTPLGKAKIQEYDTPKEQLVLRLENGKSFRVNLSDMTCSDEACKKAEEQHCACRPDTVTRDVLERIDSPDIAMALLDLDRANGVVLDQGLADSDRIETSGPTQRRRRSHGGEGRGGNGGSEGSRTPRRRSKGSDDAQRSGAAKGGKSGKDVVASAQHGRRGQAQEATPASGRRRRRHVSGDDLNQAFAEAARKDARRTRRAQAPEAAGDAAERAEQAGRSRNAQAGTAEGRSSRRRRHSSAAAEGSRRGQRVDAANDSRASEAAASGSADARSDRPRRKAEKDAPGRSARTRSDRSGAAGSEQEGRASRSSRRHRSAADRAGRNADRPEAKADSGSERRPAGAHFRSDRSSSDRGGNAGRQRSERGSKPNVPSVAEQLQNSEVTVTRRRPGDKGGAARQAQQAAGAADAAPEKSGSARRRRRRRPGDKGGQRGASGADQSGSAE